VALLTFSLCMLLDGQGSLSYDRVAALPSTGREVYGLYHTKVQSTKVGCGLRAWSIAADDARHMTRCCIQERSPVACTTLRSRAQRSVERPRLWSSYWHSPRSPVFRGGGQSSLQVFSLWVIIPLALRTGHPFNVVLLDALVNPTPFPYGQVYIHDVTLVSPLTLLLFGGRLTTERDHSAASDRSVLVPEG
jgi:hypothetical protein